LRKETVMTTYVVPDGMKRKPTAEEWETLLESRIPELIRRAKAGNLDPDALNSTMQKVIEGELIGVLPAQTKPPILRLISNGKNIVIRATSGEWTIAQATDVFLLGVDPDFTTLGLDVPGEAKPETPVEVYEMTEDGNFKTIFGSFGHELDELCLTQEQVIAFVEDHKDWFRKHGFGTFFLFKVAGKFSVADVRLGDSIRLSIDAYRFWHDFVWGGGYHHRLVVPRVSKP